MEPRCVQCDHVQRIDHDCKIENLRCERCGFHELSVNLQPMCPACKSRETEESGPQLRYD